MQGSEETLAEVSCKGRSKKKRVPGKSPLEDDQNIVGFIVLFNKPMWLKYISINIIGVGFVLADTSIISEKVTSVHLCFFSSSSVKAQPRSYGFLKCEI